MVTKHRAWVEDTHREQADPPLGKGQPQRAFAYFMKQEYRVLSVGYALEATTTPVRARQQPQKTSCDKEEVQGLGKYLEN